MNKDGAFIYALFIILLVAILVPHIIIISKIDKLETETAEIDFHVGGYYEIALDGWGTHTFFVREMRKFDDNTYYRLIQIEDIPDIYCLEKDNIWCNRKDLEILRQVWLK